MLFCRKEKILNVLSFCSPKNILTDNIPNKREKGGGGCLFVNFRGTDSLSACEHAPHLLLVPLCLSI